MAVSIDQFSGKQKTAMLLLFLGPELAAPIYSKLDEEQIEEITLEIAKLQNVEKEVIDAVIAEFYELMKANEYIAQGGKTGTTNQQRTAWFAGITPKYVTTVYIGYDNNKPMPRSYTGGGLTAKLWGKYYQALVDSGYDTGEEFNHIADGIQNGKLSKVLIDSKNGRLADSTSGSHKRWALFKKGTEPVEMAAAYNEEMIKIFIICCSHFNRFCSLFK